MKTVAIIPIKQKSERVPGKNLRLVGEKPLYQYLLDKLSSCNFDEVFIDSDSEEIKEYSKRCQTSTERSKYVINNLHK